MLAPQQHVPHGSTSALDLSVEGLEAHRVGSVLVVRWSGIPRAPEVARLRGVLRAVPADVLFHVIDLRGLPLSSLGPPDGTTRDQLALLGQETERMLRGAGALMLANNGLVMAAARASILGIRKAARSTMPFEVSSEPAALCRFAAAHARENHPAALAALLASIAA